MRSHMAVFALCCAAAAAGCSAVTNSASPTTTYQRPSASPQTTDDIRPTTTDPVNTGSLSTGPNFGVQVTPCVYGLFHGQATLPDARCTPGTTNPAVTQATIHSTICLAGYTESVRPPESTTYPEKRTSMSAYGRNDSTGNYEYDHLVSLEVGGAVNSAANLWPEQLTGPYGARVKDVLESKLHDLVCSGALSLAVAQYEEATNWVAAYNRYVGPLG